MIACRDTGEEVEGYEEYRRTEHLKIFAARYSTTRRWKGECWCCEEDLEIPVIHHIRRTHLGKERLKDVVGVCESCYSEIEGIHGDSWERHKLLRAKKRGVDYHPMRKIAPLDDFRVFKKVGSLALHGKIMKECHNRAHGGIPVDKVNEWAGRLYRALKRELESDGKSYFAFKARRRHER